MTKRLKTYVRPARRRSGLTQRELAFLVGVKDGAAVSRMERLKRVPSLLWTRACALVFDIPAAQLFPQMFREIHEVVRRRANDLYEELQGNPSKATRLKLDFLEELLARLDREPSDAV
jgi:transcriptional regulator with XRE-family HTH domain